MRMKKAIEVLKKAPHFPHEKIGAKEAINVAINAMEKAEKYRWHDLRENPYDVPIHGKCVETMSKSGLYIINYNDLYKCGVRGWRFDHENIIAWREIEPFEC